MMYKALLFDAGGVVVSMGSQLDGFVKIFHPKDKNEFWKKINHFLGPLACGDISEAEYWQRIAESEGIDSGKVPKDLWLLNYESTTHPVNELLSWIDELRKIYKVILVSNTIAPHVKINQKRGIFDHFDDVVNSCQVHLSKDSPEIFTLALNRNNLKPNESIFIDDIQKFVDMAESLGIKGILFKDVTQLRQDLSTLGI